MGIPQSFPVERGERGSPRPPVERIDGLLLRHVPKLFLAVLTVASPALAQTAPSVTIGGGVQTSLRPQLTGRRGRHRPVSLEQRAPLRERYRHSRHQDHVQHRIRTARRTRSRCSTPQRSSSSRRSSTSGSAVSCRPATAPTCMARTTRTIGPCTGRRPGRLPLHLPRPRQRRDVLGPVRQGEAVGRRVRRYVADRRRHRSLSPGVSRSTSGTPKTATT